MRHHARAHSSTPARSWLAVRGRSPEAIRTELRLRESRVPGDDKLTFQIVGASSDAGWYLIVASGRDHRLVEEAAVARLSAGCEVLTCRADEASMFSAAAAWNDGHRAWAVTYDGEDGPTDAVIEGELPFAFSGIQAECTAKARAEDVDDALVDPMFEFPIAIVDRAIGYKPGADSPAFKGRFALLEGLDTPWLKRLIFGG